MMLQFRWGQRNYDPAVQTRALKPTLTASLTPRLQSMDDRETHRRQLVVDPLATRSPPNNQMTREKLRRMPMD